MGFLDWLGGGVDFQGAQQDFEKRQRGVDFGITAADQDMAKKSIGYTGDLARMQLEEILPQILAQVSGRNSARGFGGSSADALQRSAAGQDQARMIQEMLLREQMQTAQALPQMATQRANMEMGRNAQLFQSLIGSYQAQAEQRGRGAGALGGIVQGVAKVGIGLATGGLSGAGTALGTGMPASAGAATPNIPAYPDPWANQPMSYNPYGRR